MIRTNIRIYSYQKNNTNEYLNIFASKKWYEHDTNEYSYWKIFEYPNIRHTLVCKRYLVHSVSASDILIARQWCELVKEGRSERSVLCDINLTQFASGVRASGQYEEDTLFKEYDYAGQSSPNVGCKIIIETNRYSRIWLRYRIIWEFHPKNSS